MKMKAARCLNCSKELDAAGHVEQDGSKPESGDLTICLYCGHLMAFDKLGFRELTQDEIHEVAGDQTLLSALAFRQAYIKDNPP